MKKKDKGYDNKHPFAVNIKNLQKYDFSKTNVDEVVFFEWLVIKRISFGTKPFYYQQRRVIEEIGVKRTRLETIKNKFKEYGLLVDNDSIFNTTNYTVTLDFIKKFIDTGVKKDDRSSKFLGIKNIDFTKEKTISNIERKKINLLIDQLNDLFNTRRKIYSDESEEEEYQYTTLPINEKSYQQLLRLKKVYDDTTIKNGFVSYCDDVIKYKDRVVKSHMINHFSSYEYSIKTFPVFERHLHNYNLNYSLKK